MAGPQLGAMCAALAEAAGLGQELRGEGQLLQAGERLPAAGRGICSGPGARQPSRPVRDPVRLSGRGDRSGLP